MREPLALFVERLIGTARREFLDHFFFWNVADLQPKLDAFQHYYNTQRVHTSLDSRPPTADGDQHRPCHVGSFSVATLLSRTLRTADRSVICNSPYTGSAGVRRVLLRSRPAPSGFATENTDR